MKKLFIFAVIMLVVTFSANVFAESNITKAENFIKAERWSQAIKALENEISENSDNAKAYFMLGTIYFSQKNYPRADKEFASAIAFKSSYRSDVGKKYQAAGLDSLNRGNVLEAVKLFTRAIKHQPGLSKNIANTCFQAGKKYFSVFRDDLADKLFSLAKSDTSLVKQIKVEEIRYGEKILAEAKKELSEEKRQVAIKYLDREKVNTEFPPKDWQTVPGSKKTFEGKGTSGDNPIKVAEYGAEIKKGYKIVIISENNKDFYVANGDEWVLYQGSCEIINRTGDKGYLYVLTEDRKKFHFELQQFIYPTEKEKVILLSSDQ